MDLEFWDCFGRKKTPSYNRRNTVSMHQVPVSIYSFENDLSDQVPTRIPHQVTVKPVGLSHPFSVMGPGPLELGKIASF